MKKNKIILKFIVSTLAVLGILAILFWITFYIILVRRPKYIFEIDNKRKSYDLYYENTESNIKYYSKVDVNVYEDRGLFKKNDGSLSNLIKKRQTARYNRSR